MATKPPTRSTWKHLGLRSQTFRPRHPHLARAILSIDRKFGQGINPGEFNCTKRNLNKLVEGDFFNRKNPIFIGNIYMVSGEDVLHPEPHHKKPSSEMQTFKKMPSPCRFLPRPLQPHWRKPFGLEKSGGAKKVPCRSAADPRYPSPTRSEHLHYGGLHHRPLGAPATLDHIRQLKSKSTDWLAFSAKTSACQVGKHPLFCRDGASKRFKTIN